ncbi:MAG TPA: C39 family peptidase [Patescibacteria group bacterium]
MPNSSNNFAFPELTRIRQENSSYCGPAVIQMLLDFLGYPITQDDFVAAADIGGRIQAYGTTIDDMVRAVKVLFPNLQFWYKFNSSLTDISKVVNVYGYPVGVEWQGVFDYPDDDEDDDTDDYEDDDPGHYSVVTHIDTSQNMVMIADPERHYAGSDRRFTILSFEHRWWDINEIIDPITHHTRQVDENHAMFIITPKDALFPLDLNMIRS